MYIFFSMDGFRVVRINEVVRSIDILVTATGMLIFLSSVVSENKMSIFNYN